MKVVLANGCFDGLHAGHLMHLQQARLMGDLLVVSVTRDAFVNKGPGRPIFKEAHRVKSLESLRCVNGVFLVDSVMDALQYRPPIFVKGPDYSIDTIEPEHREFCEKHGIEIRFTTGEKLSSRALFK